MAVAINYQASHYHKVATYLVLEHLRLVTNNLNDHKHFTRV